MQRLQGRRCSYLRLVGLSIGQRDTCPTASQETSREQRSAYPLEHDRYIWILLKADHLTSSLVLSLEGIWTGNLKLCLFPFNQIETQHAFQVPAATCASCPPSIPRATSVSVQRDCFFHLLAHAAVSSLVRRMQSTKACSRLAWK